MHATEINKLDVSYIYIDMNKYLHNDNSFYIISITIRLRFAHHNSYIHILSIISYSCGSLIFAYNVANTYIMCCG